MRGRLIQRFKAVFARLDTETIESTDNYDEDFRDIKKVSTGDGIGTTQRKEHTQDEIPCQLGPGTWEALQARLQGNNSQSNITMLLHFMDLENLGLVDETTGMPLIKVGDRLVSIKNIITDEIIYQVPTPPGLYITEAKQAGWGLNMSSPTRNLLQLTLEERSAVE